MKQIEILVIAGVVGAAVVYFIISLVKSLKSAKSSAGTGCSCGSSENCPMAKTCHSADKDKH